MSLINGRSSISLSLVPHIKKAESSETFFCLLYEHIMDAPRVDLKCLTFLFAVS